MKLHTILPKAIFQRGNLLRYPEDQVFDLLAERNIRCVLGMACEEDTQLRNLLGSSYLWYPIADGLLKDPAPLHAIVSEALALRRETGGAILTYCRAGRNRSGLMSALLLMELTGCDGEQAVERVRAGRPNALANPHLVTYLQSLQSPLL
jgi:hypothetical protein